MHDLSEYRIEVKGRLEEESINAASPIQLNIEKATDSESAFTIYADQSGMVGLIRFLHRQGFIILSVSRQRQTILIER